jgi:hypothetical protein
MATMLCSIVDKETQFQKMRLSRMALLTAPRVERKTLWLDLTDFAINIVADASNRSQWTGRPFRASF